MTNYKITYYSYHVPRLFREPTPTIKYKISAIIEADTPGEAIKKFEGETIKKFKE